MNESRSIHAIKCQVLITVQLFALNLNAFWHFFKCFFFQNKETTAVSTKKPAAFELSTLFISFSAVFHQNTHTYSCFFFLKYYHQTTLQFIHCPNPKKSLQLFVEKCHPLFQSLTSLFSSTAIIMLNLIASKPICYAKNLHSISLLRLFPLDHSSVTRLRLRQCTLAI